MWIGGGFEVLGGGFPNWGATPTGALWIQADGKLSDVQMPVGTPFQYRRELHSFQGQLIDYLAVRPAGELVARSQVGDGISHQTRVLGYAA
ncbi:hypothetical protein O181_019161 [Austropuccinia psidii MF-1]|uniref:Uncharacterized protein n=1 Tax=Austropuccinia psidii MF-1 TaxID=1389203 RepID=A0A9Q3C6M2_9BASI|nr:hypothetical protein [Austropuccinia psidii MF-1]